MNAAGFLPTQPDVEMTSEFIQGIQPYLEDFKLSWDQLFINRQNVGQYISEASVHAEMLKPAGPIATPEELAGKSQADWDLLCSKVIHNHSYSWHKLAACAGIALGSEPSGQTRLLFRFSYVLVLPHERCEDDVSVWER